MHKVGLKGFGGLGWLWRSLYCSPPSACPPTPTPISSSLFQHRVHWKAGKDGLPNKRSGGGDSLRHKKIAAQILDVVSAAFAHRPYNSDLLLRCGLEISKVKMSPNLRVAYILWSSSPGMQRTVEKELKIHVVRLRSMLFSELSMPFSPKVVFMEDKPSKHSQELEEALAEIKERDSQV